jgi:hypothetical protein
MPGNRTVPERGIASPRQNPVTEYRAYLLGSDDRFISCRVYVCDNDSDAIVWAKQLLDGHDMELWSGPRLVKRLNVIGKQGGEAVSHEVVDGRMLPKK